MLKQFQQFDPNDSEHKALIVEVVPFSLGDSCSDRPSPPSAWQVYFRTLGQTVLTWSQIAEALVQSPTMRQQWNQVWADIPTDFMWKPVPIHPDFATTHPFFAIAVASTFPAANAIAYQEHLQHLSLTEQVAVFPNLGGDAELVVPKATGAYGHIRAFCQLAPPLLQDAFWLRVGEIALYTIQQKQTVWCNTHGHGVPWMHIRFDSLHKYPAFPPYGPITSASQQQWYTMYEKR